MKKLFVILLSLLLCLTFTACSSSDEADEEQTSDNDTTEETTTYTVGICNYVDDASLNQIVENIEAQLEVIAAENNVTIEIKYDNCNGDSNVLAQIVSDFIADEVDLMVGVATPVAMVMQASTEENQIPVIFAAVSDPVGSGIVDSLETPGANISGTSDYLDTNAIMDIIFAVDPDTDVVGLLYDVGQDSSTTAIAEAKEYLDAKGVSYVEKTGTNVSEISLAADALIDEGITVVFTPSDNTVMEAELTIYEKFAEAGVKHYAGADSFALNGSFLGYGVDYANLGVETANMVKEVLIDGADISTLAVQTFDNGIATINTDICEILGLDYDELAELLAPYCTTVQPITTAESFE